MSRHPGRAGAHSAGFSAGGRHAATDRPADDDSEDIPDRAVLLAGVARDARLDRKYLLLITLSAAIATLGLLQGSAAVVIGAMLVSPLLGPIMGIGFGLATLESELIRRSLVTLAAGIAAAIAVAMLIVWLSPVNDVTAEIRGRTQPTLLDLGVAVVGGVAGVYAILRKLSGVMVGVAIATALVPPLSTIGFGLVTDRFDFALGASLLFLTNTLAIAFAATLVARLNRFGPSLTPRHTVLQLVGILTVLGILSIPLALSLNRIAREIAALSIVQTVIDGQLADADRVDSLNVRRDGEGVRVDGVILVDQYQPTLSADVATRASERLRRPVAVDIVQLRKQSDSANELDDRTNRRLVALERGSEQSQSIVAALTVGGLIDRSAITLDPQTRRALVTIGGSEENDQIAEARNRIIAEAQRAHGDWFIARGASQSSVRDPQ